MSGINVTLGNRMIHVCIGFVVLFLRLPRFLFHLISSFNPFQEHLEVTFIEWLVPLIVCALLTLLGIGIAILYLRANDCARAQGADDDVRLVRPGNA